MPSVISKDNTKISYSKQGSGPVLILVLGALNKRVTGKKLAQQLINNFTVITYDRRGRGDSTDTMPYSIDKEVDDIEAIIDELGGRAYLYGHSSGGILALYAAERLGKKINGLAVYEVPYNDDSQGKKEHEKYEINLQKLLDENNYADAVSLFIKSVGVSEKQIAALKRLPMWKSLIAMAHTLKYDTIELMNKYPKIKLQEITTPTLVLYGALSPEFMSNTAKSMHNTLPKASLQSLEKQTHDVKPAVIAPELIKFFS